MTEQEIRQQTQIIWEAYIFLMGDADIPEVNITDFLKIRERAIQELMVLPTPIQKKTAKDTPPAKKAAPGAVSQAVTIKRKEEKQQAAKSSGFTPVPSAGTAKAGYPSHENTTSSKKEELSEYEILRRIEDKWN